MKPPKVILVAILLLIALFALMGWEIRNLYAPQKPIPFDPNTKSYPLSDSERNEYLGYHSLCGGDHNILLGPFAGYNFTTESYQFCFSVGGNEQYRTTMSPEEFEVVEAVVKRAIQNKEPIFDRPNYSTEHNRFGSDNVLIEVEPGKAFTSLQEYKTYSASLNLSKNETLTSSTDSPQP